MEKHVLQFRYEPNRIPGRLLSQRRQKRYSRGDPSAQKGKIRPPPPLGSRQTSFHITHVAAENRSDAVGGVKPCTVPAQHAGQHGARLPGRVREAVADDGPAGGGEVAARVEVRLQRVLDGEGRHPPALEDGGYSNDGKKWGVDKGAKSQKEAVQFPALTTTWVFIRTRSNSPPSPEGGVQKGGPAAKLGQTETQHQMKHKKNSADSTVLTKNKIKIAQTNQK